MVSRSTGAAASPVTTTTRPATSWPAGCTRQIPRVKIKIGESWGRREDRDLERVALAREVIGPGAQLYVDANGGYGVGQAVRVAHRLASTG